MPSHILAIDPAVRKARPKASKSAIIAGDRPNDTKDEQQGPHTRSTLLPLPFKHSEQTTMAPTWKKHDLIFRNEENDLAVYGGGKDAFIRNILRQVAPYYLQMNTYEKKIDVAEMVVWKVENLKPSGRFFIMLSGDKRIELLNRGEAISRVQQYMERRLKKAEKKVKKEEKDEGTKILRKLQNNISKSPPTTIADESKNQERLRKAVLHDADGFRLFQEKRYRGALNAYSKALKIRREVLYKSSLDTAKSLDNVGEVFCAMGYELSSDYAKEQSLAIQKFSTFQMIYDHTVNYYHMIAVELLKQGYSDAAFDAFQKSLELIESIEWSQPSLLHAICLENMAFISFTQGNLEDSLARNRIACDILEEIKPGSLSVAKSRWNIGLILLQQRDLFGAVKEHQKALEIHKILAPFSLETANSHDMIGNILIQQGRFHEAFQHCCQALTIKEKLGPQESQSRIELQYAIGTCLERKGFDRRDLAYFFGSPQQRQPLPLRSSANHQYGVGNHAQKIRWTTEEDKLLLILKSGGDLSWKTIADVFPGRGAYECQYRHVRLITEDEKLKIRRKKRKHLNG